MKKFLTTYVASTLENLGYGEITPVKYTDLEAFTHIGKDMPLELAKFQFLDCGLSLGVEKGIFGYIPSSSYGFWCDFALYDIPDDIQSLASFDYKIIKIKIDDDDDDDVQFYFDLFQLMGWSIYSFNIYGRGCHIYLYTMSELADALYNKDIDTIIEYLKKPGTFYREYVFESDYKDDLEKFIKKYGKKN